MFEDQHLERLTKASRYFAYPFDPEELRQKIEEECQACDSHQDYRLRISPQQVWRDETQSPNLNTSQSKFLQSQTLSARSRFESIIYLL